MSIDEEMEKDFADLIALVDRIQEERQRPLLVLFYPPRASIIELNIELLHEALTSEGKLSRKTPLEDLDVLLHTAGGEPTAAYRLAQLIREYTKQATFLVPEYAYSGGTLMCLSADNILLGDYAVISPIDITLVSRRTGEEDDRDRELFPEEKEGESEIELVAIDYFIQVAKNARVELEREFRRRGWKLSRTDVESSLLCKMTDELGVLNIAKYYREKNITQEYAKQLLNQRMFAERRDGPTKLQKVDRILRSLVVEAPSHEYPMDYNICEAIGLNVEHMSESLAGTTRELTRHLTTMAHAGKIGQSVGRDRTPFFQYFAFEPSSGLAPSTDTAFVGGEAEHGDKNDTNSTTGPKEEEEHAEPRVPEPASGAVDGSHPGDA